MTRDAAAAFLFDEGDPPSKRRLLEAALGLFAGRGLHAVNVREVAERAGYTNPALFKFFATKDELALYLFERCYLELAHTIERERRPSRGFKATFHALLLAQDGFVVRHADAWFFLQEHARELWPRVSLSVKRASLARVVREVLEQGKSEGAVDARLDLDVATAALMGAYQQFTRVRALGGLGKDRDTSLASLEKLLRSMLAPQRSRSLKEMNS